MARQLERLIGFVFALTLARLSDNTYQNRQGLLAEVLIKEGIYMHVSVVLTTCLFIFRMRSGGNSSLTSQIILCPLFNGLFQGLQSKAEVTEASSLVFINALVRYLITALLI